MRFKNTIFSLTHQDKKNAFKINYLKKVLAKEIKQY